MTSLQDYLAAWAGHDAGREPVAATLIAIAQASARLSKLVAEGPLAGELGAIVGESRDGDGQKALDVRANDLLREALQDAPVAALASEEDAEPVALRAGAPVAVAIDPLDGSNNINANAPIATICSLMPSDAGADPGAAFQLPGDRQLAAAFALYGPHTSLVLTVRRGVQIFTLDRRDGVFRLTRPAAIIPTGRHEYAINASNQRHWAWPVRAYVEDCLAGEEGPRGSNYNMRWLACVAAEVFRILLRGGVYLYPGDQRPGYQQGRLRLLYEANPLAVIVEEAGGVASNSLERILSIVPKGTHQRVPLILGARDEVERITAHHALSQPSCGRPALFGKRGLFRA